MNFIFIYSFIHRELIIKKLILYLRIVVILINKITFSFSITPESTFSERIYLFILMSIQFDNNKISNYSCASFSRRKNNKG